MEIIIGKLAGFCPGVSNAVEKTKDVLSKNQKVYCLGELVHNGQVIKSLEKIGLITVNKIEEVPDNETVIIRAHGEPENTYEIAKSKNLNVIDLTCVKVKLIHDIVKKQRKDSFIIIIGKKKHPEVIGIKGFAGENSYIIENEDDILDAYMEYEKTNLGKVYVVSQTTMSSKFFDELSKEVEKNFIETDIIIDKTICSATEKRQSEVKEISQKVNNMIIIGGKNSSNTKELAQIANQNCGKVYLIETKKELENENFDNVEKIGIMAGASTPKESIEEVKFFLERY